MNEFADSQVAEDELAVKRLGAGIVAEMGKTIWIWDDMGMFIGILGD